MSDYKSDYEFIKKSRFTIVEAFDTWCVLRIADGKWKPVLAGVYADIGDAADYIAEEALAEGMSAPDQDKNDQATWDVQMEGMAKHEAEME